MAFKANDHEETGGNFDPAPAGQYQLALVKVERKESSKAGNWYQNCQFKVIGGKHKGKIIFHMLHLDNATEQAVKIARGQLSSLMNAIGIGTIDDEWNLEPLMNKPFMARVKVTTDPNGQYDPKNEIARFLAETSATKDSDKVTHGPGDEPWDTGNTKKKKKKKEEGQNTGANS